MPNQNRIKKPIWAYRELLGLAERLHPRGLFYLPSFEEKVVALTIDDGPSVRTHEILDILDRHDAKATFFVHVDRISDEKGGIKVFQRMIEAGHEIANHMPDHKLSLKLKAQEFDAEFQRAHNLLSEIGPPPRLFRAAGGFFNVERMLPTLERLNYFQRFIMASYLPWDTHIPLPRQYAFHLAAGAFPGAIFVLHDGRDSPKRLDRTIQALQFLMVDLKKLGFRVEALGRLLSHSAPGPSE